MKQTALKLAAKVLIVLLALPGVIIVSCDSFEPDSISKQNEVIINNKNFYTTPGTSAVIDLKSLVKSYSSVKITVTDEPGHGNLARISEAVFNYKPHKSFTKGKDYFGIEISKDGQTLKKDSIIIYVDHDTTNFPCSLYAISDSLIVPSSASAHDLKIPVLDNDRVCGVSKNDVVLSVYVAPQYGTASVINESGEPKILYNANSQFDAHDRFVYKISMLNDTLKYSYALVSINTGDTTCSILPVDDSYIVLVNQHSALSYTCDVLSNDHVCSWMDSSLLALHIIMQPINGSAQIVNNKIVYQVPSPFTGSVADSLQYEVCYNGVCKKATVVLSFFYDQICETIAFDDYAVLSDTVSATQLTIPALKNDSICGNNLNGFQIIKQPKYGVADVLGREIFYQANNATTPPDTLRYQICDSNNHCSSAYIYINRQ